MFTLPAWLKSTLFLGLPLAFVALWGSGRLYHRVGPGMVPPVQANEARTVHVETLVAHPTDVTQLLPGTVKAEHVAVLAARLMASIDRVLVEEGDTVYAGQVLVTLDARDVGAQVAQARANAARSAAGIHSAMQGHNAAKSALAEAQARLTAAASNWRRVEDLHAEGGVSDQDFNEAESRYRSAVAQVAQAREGVELGVSRIAEAQANLSQSEAGRDLALTNQSYARLVAPFDGVVVKRWAEPGALTSPGQPLLQLERGPFRVDVPVGERTAQAIQVSAPVTVLIDGEATPAAGKVQRIVPAVDPVSRSALVKIALPDLPRLRSGVYARAGFSGERANRISLPTRALVRWYDLTSTFVVGSDGTVSLRLVRVGETRGDRIEVLSGLAAGEQVVLDPPSGLRDGDRVSVAQ